MVNVLKLSIKINDEKSIVQFAEKINDNILTRTEQKSLAHLHLARHKLANGQNREAIQDLEFVIENSNNEETAEARYLISKIYYDENQLDEASERVREAYSKNGGYPKWVAKSLLLNAQILIKQEDVCNAKASVEAVIDNFAGYSEIIAEG